MASCIFDLGPWAKQSVAGVGEKTVAIRADAGRAGIPLLFPRRIITRLLSGKSGYLAIQLVANSVKASGLEADGIYGQMQARIKAYWAKSNLRGYAYIYVARLLR